MGSFEAFYASSLQHPILLWLAAVIAMGICATQQGLDASLRRYCLGLGVLSLLDAWLSSEPIYGLGSLSGGLASGVPLFFVLAGDFRYLFFAVSATPSGQIEFSGIRLAQALGFTMVVPLSTQVILHLLPDSMQTSRVMFLIYEVSFVALTLCLLRYHKNVRSILWVSRVSRFVIVYYSLWAAADLIILMTGADLGYLLRVLPNLLYYGGLIAVMARLAPPVHAPLSPLLQTRSN